MPVIDDDYPRIYKVRTEHELCVEKRFLAHVITATHWKALHESSNRLELDPEVN